MPTLIECAACTLRTQIKSVYSFGYSFENLFDLFCSAHEFNAVSWLVWQSMELVLQLAVDCVHVACGMRLAGIGFNVQPILIDKIHRASILFAIHARPDDTQYNSIKSSLTFYSNADVGPLAYDKLPRCVGPNAGLGSWVGIRRAN